MNATFYGLKAMMSARLLTDMEISVKEEKFQCHQFVLCSASPYLRQELHEIKSQKRKLDSLNFHQMTPESVSHFLYFLYIGKPPPIWYWNMIEIFFIACFLEIDVLIQYSVMYLTQHCEFKDIYVNGHRDPEELEKMMHFAEKLDIQLLVNTIKHTRRDLRISQKRLDPKLEQLSPQLKTDLETQKEAHMRLDLQKQEPFVKIGPKIKEQRTALLDAAKTEVKGVPEQDLQYRPSTIGLDEETDSGESKFTVQQFSQTRQPDQMTNEEQIPNKINEQKEDNSWFAIAPAMPVAKEKAKSQYQAPKQRSLEAPTDSSTSHFSNEMC
ncbi:hypothetical protein B4U79_17266 [Dinothrombium tinctorium]|uniref:BTB domain-containing protein n=2 Tax=Dinothrombium tinctorium TaxID=1965070 RepID=A0A3S3PGK6_9ACAR|nr:hypothetical protein B4U79_16560 [Dinothrombium tinctorium]RWS02975.1 hypothetical protein B4U79_16559 [Dinothrombium tinctorium]RWS14817.1 hypothetical protein B4U79_17266 [Dinothrombium tinctorium]